MGTGALLYSPSFMSHLEIASSQCLGKGRWVFRLAPDTSMGSLCRAIEQNNHCSALGTLEKKVEMEIMTLVGNTRKALISNSANQ